MKTNLKIKMRTTQLIGQLGLGLCLFGWSNDASALSCNEIIGMVGYNLPTDVILETMKNSGTRFSKDEIQCLVEKGAPAQVVEQARKMSAEASRPQDPIQIDRPKIEEEDNTPTADLSEDGSGNDPEEIKNAIKLIRAEKPLTASYMIYQLLAENTYPEQESRLHYYLAKALSDLEMYHSAQHYYLEVVKKGPGDPYFEYALPKMVTLSRFTDDDSDLTRIAIRLPPEQFPRNAQNDLYYLLGTQKFNQYLLNVKSYNTDEEGQQKKNEDLESIREDLGKVSSTSPMYLQSRYIEGITYNEQREARSAVSAFRDVYKAEVDSFVDAYEKQKVENLKDLSLLNIASIYYGIAQQENSMANKLNRYLQASAYYEKVSRSSTYWAESLFRDAWSHLHMGNLNVTLGKVLTVESPYFQDTDFIPEATILKALTYFQLCEYNKVESIIGRFDQKYTPMKDEITQFLSDYQTKEQRRLADQAWNHYFGPQSDSQTVLPQAFFARVLRNRDLAGVVRHLDLMETELTRIDAEKDKWKNTVGVHLQKIIQEDKTLYERRAGLLLLEELQRQNDTLNKLLSQSQIIGFEVVDAQRVDYEFRASNSSALGDQSQFDVDFATSPDLIYWPFNGEFWADELGYYNYTEQGSCK